MALSALIDTTGPSAVAQDILPPLLAAVEPIGPLTPSMDALRALGMKLVSMFEGYERDRLLADSRYLKNLRQYLGIYDPEVEQMLPNDRSKAYPKLTRVKCVSMLSRLMNLLFSLGSKNWGCAASPVPNLETADLEMVLQKIMGSSQDGSSPTDEAVDAAIREFAQGRARNLETEIEDQLTEIGGSKQVDYVALCRKVIVSAIIFGHGVLKGPYAKKRMQRRWVLDPATQKLIVLEEEVIVPQFEFVPVWDYYPDMSARYWHQMDGQFERRVMSRRQVEELGENPDFFGDVIDQYLKDHTTGNYRSRMHETEIKSMGPHNNTGNNNDGRKYEVIVWDGHLAAADLRNSGVEVTNEGMHECVVWVLDNVVIRATLNPWRILKEDARINTYHHFVFEEEDSSLVGEGLPQIMRDSQMGLCAATRMVLDNAGVVCGQNLEVNLALLRTDQDLKQVTPHKIWYRDDDSLQTANIPAVRAIDINSHIPELQNVASMFRDFADTETFVNPATGGDMSRTPSEPYRTATGASMLRGDAALPFKDVVRNYDQFTYSVFTAIITFNRHFNMKPSVRGDFQPVALGSTSLIAKEVLGVAYDQLAQTLAPAEQLYINWRGLLRARLQVRDMAVDQIMVNDAEATRREQAQATAQQQKDAQLAELMKAEVRKLLADAVKSITQSDKNANAADATLYNAILGGLEKGVTPMEVAAARGGGGVPSGIVDMQMLNKMPQGGAQPRGN